jgi:hypothetical protein
MEVFFTIVTISVIVGTLIYRDKRYRETAYYQITKQSYWFMDKGTLGEYLIYERLRYLEDSGGRFLFNIYLPKKGNDTTEIDVLAITPSGLFVFESKNYSGWIFGHEAHKNWTQTFPVGRGRSRKERFYNPVMQNGSHITHLRPFVGEKTPVWSIIVFSDECTLKDVTIKSKNVHVVYLGDIGSAVAQVRYQMRDAILNEAEINDIYNRLYPYTQVDSQVKVQHLMNVKKNF